MKHLALIFALVLPLGPALAADVTVFAAASLNEALDEVDSSFAGGQVRVAYAASSALARQIENGAPADVFISANPEWMDELETGGYLADGTRRDLLTNRLVVAAHDKVTLTSLKDLPAALGKGRLALALTQAVPAGIYAREALENTGVWDDLAGRTAETDNVRATLALVARGEAPFGIVYATDAAASDAVHVALEIDPALHAPIVYPVALVAGAGSAARAYLNYLESDNAAAIFARHGFGIAAR